MVEKGYENYIIRPVKEDDLSSIYGISELVGPDISLPHHKETLKHKIMRSLDSFGLLNKPEDRLFFFVLETRDNRQILGTAMLEAKVAREIPLYNFTILPVQQMSNGMTDKMRELLIWGMQYQDASLLCTLFLSAKARGLGLGRFISRSRCLFIAEFPHFFSDLIIANMRGVFTTQDESPFWDAVGKRLFNKKINKAFFLYTTGHINFLKKRAPIHPIYLDLLSKKAREAIGKTHPETKPALHLLEKEGFSYRNVIDIFDGGPIIEAPKVGLRAVRESRVATVANINLEENLAGRFIICNTSLEFRVVVGSLKQMLDGTVAITKTSAQALNVSLNDKIRFYAV